MQNGTILEQVVLKSPPKNMVLFAPREEEEGGHIEIESVLGDSLPQIRLQGKGGECRRICLKIRHALYDAFYLAIVFQDLCSAYTQQALSRGPSFHDWLSHIDSLDLAASRKFWTQGLHGSRMTYLVAPTRLPTSGNPSRDDISMRVPLIGTTHGTASSVVQAAWALVLSRVTGQKDITFGVPNANRNSDFPDTDRVRGPCLTCLPLRVCLDHADVTTLGSLVARIQAQAVAAIPHQYVGFRDIFKNCTGWPSWTRFGSVVQYQNHELSQLGSSLRFGDVDCAISAHGEIGQSADVFVLATPESSELSIQMFYSKRTLPEEKAQWIARRFQTILESMPAALEEPIHRIAPDQQSVPASVAAASVADPPSHDSSAAQNRLPSRPPTADTRTLVAEAWDEVGLAMPHSDGQRKEDTSMYSCGGDLVTTLLLSRCYRRRGFSLSMQDCIDHPTQEGQARLIEFRKEMHGEKEVHDKIEVDGEKKMNGENKVNGKLEPNCETQPHRNISG